MEEWTEEEEVQEPIEVEQVEGTERMKRYSIVATYVGTYQFRRYCSNLCCKQRNVGQELKDYLFQKSEAPAEDGEKRFDPSGYDKDLVENLERDIVQKNPNVHW